MVFQVTYCLVIKINNSSNFYPCTNLPLILLLIPTCLLPCFLNISHYVASSVLFYHVNQVVCTGTAEFLCGSTTSLNLCSSSLHSHLYEPADQQGRGLPTGPGVVEPPDPDCDPRARGAAGRCHLETATEHHHGYFHGAWETLIINMMLLRPVLGCSKC